MSKVSKRAIFLDRDGVINKIVMHDGMPCSPRCFEEFQLIDGVKESLRVMKQKGFLIIIVTNQPELARGLVKASELEKMHSFVRDNLPVDDIYICVHDDNAKCFCRKPKPGMLLDASKKWDIDLNDSFMIGDRGKDLEAGERAGCCSILVDTEYNKDIDCRYRVSKISDVVSMLDKYPRKFNPKNILVTGGCGFIGSHLVDRLVKCRHNVHVIDDLSTGLKDNINMSASYCFDDIKSYIGDSHGIEKIITDKQIDVVYHLAACADIRKSIENPLFVYQTNVLSSIAIANICKKSGVKKFVFASTSAVYGEPKYLPVDESHPTYPISPYGLTKLAFEQYLEFIKDEKMSVTVLRFPNIYGPRQRPDLEGGVVAIFYNNMKQNKEIIFFGDGKQTRDWVHVYDIVDALLGATEGTNDYDVFSLGSEIETTLFELFDAMKETLKYNKMPIFKLERAGDIKHMVMSSKKAVEHLKWKAKIPICKGVSLIECK